MFLLFGTRATATILTVVRFTCLICGVDAHQRVVKSRNRFTFFFVPLFSFSTSYYNECSHCGGTTALTQDQVDNALGWVGGSATSA